MVIKVETDRVSNNNKTSMTQMGNLTTSSSNRLNSEKTESATIIPCPQIKVSNSIIDCVCIDPQGFE
jgi:hypothetical protein